MEKLYRLRYIGGRHTELKNIHKGMKGISEKEIEHTLKYLINQGIIQTSIKTKEIHVSINPKKNKRSTQNTRGITNNFSQEKISEYSHSKKC